MKKIYTLLLFLGVTLGLQAQEFNFIPSSPDIQKLGDGWFKFDLEGTYFDVEIKGGQLSQGNIRWFDGSQYSGSLAGSNFSGRGTYKWADGSRYEGSFKDHQRHGKGSLINVDGTKWSGKWKENQKNGKGKVFDKDGNILEQGVWKSNKLVAKK